MRAAAKPALQKTNTSRTGFIFTSREPGGRQLKTFDGGYSTFLKQNLFPALGTSVPNTRLALRSLVKGNIT